MSGDAPLVGPTDPPGLHVMSYNIRRLMAHAGRGSADWWPRRRELLGRVLRAEQPSVLGVQEAMPSQAEELSEALGPNYHRVGHGRRADGTGEGCPVFYDGDRLELVRWTQHALSPTPAEPGSRGWGNLVPRIAVECEFRSRATDDRFIALNVHLDHLSRRSRVHSAEFIAELARASAHPLVTMGDFNAPADSPTYRVLADAGLRDTWLEASDRRGDDVGTYSGYHDPKPGGRRIDWMFASDGVAVPIAAINAVRFEGRAPSDHEPIHAVLALG